MLLTTSSNFVENIVVRKDTLLCKSDHFLLTFDIDLKCKRSKVIKRDCFNYKKANWDSLNAELNEISWPPILESMHPDSAWQNFTVALTSSMERHIPKIRLKSKFQPIWYDSECHRKCKVKEKLHKKYKLSGSLNDGIKFATVRKEFKNLVNQKLRDNLYDDNDTNLLSKKFWNYVKQTSKSNRIPEVVCHNSTISHDTKTKADMFNKFFQDQFSNPSTYNIDINFDTDDEFDIDFSPSRIETLLEGINTNKVCGPE